MNHTFLRIATALVLLTAAPALFAQYQYFEDVPPSTKYFGVANRLWERTITKGCLAEPHFFCGEAGVSRADMAVLVVRTLYSVLVPGNAEGFTPPSTPYFDDVPASHPRFRYIQQLKFLGITGGCTATTYCPDYSVTNSQVAVFSVRARQLLLSGYNYNGYVYSLGSVNNTITCPSYYQCAPYYNDVNPASSPLFPWIQLAREQSGPMIQPPNCSTWGFCPEDPITRGQIAFFLVYGVLGSMGLPPQQMGQGGTGSLLPPVTGVDCTSGSVLVSNDIYLLSPQDYYSASSTRGTYPDPSLWTMTVTASLNRDGTTVFAQPAQPVKTDANSNLRFPSSGTASLVPGNYLQTAAHTAVNGPCSLSSSVTSYSYPGNGTALFFPPTITSVSPAFASPGSTITVTVAAAIP